MRCLREVLVPDDERRRESEQDIDTNPVCAFEVLEPDVTNLLVGGYWWCVGQRTCADIVFIHSVTKQLVLPAVSITNNFVGFMLFGCNLS